MQLGVSVVLDSEERQLAGVAVPPPYTLANVRQAVAAQLGAGH